jgi:hypothetical protein
VAVRLLYLIFRHVMGTAGPQRTIKECRDSRVAARGRCVTPPGMQTATVLGRVASQERCKKPGRGLRSMRLMLCDGTDSFWW